ncbi:MAG: hypothetical protein HEP71_21190 [Roseivirga sp.]|nr:hypothetical protein [Roseivirga sp.]
MKQLALLLLILGVFCLQACQQQQAGYTPEGLRKLTSEELIEKAKHWELVPYQTMTLKNSEGATISFDSLLSLWQVNPMAVDSYVNENDSIVEGVIRLSTPEDSILNQQIMVAYNTGPDAKSVKVNCEDLKSILDDLYEKDQGSRKGGSAPHPAEDFKYLEIAISIIEQCGMPTLENVDRKHINTLWLVFQHGTHRYRKEYFSYFQMAAEKDELNKGSVALMQDRILMGDKKPQIYGSQVRGSGPDGSFELYELQDPEYVDQRRAEMGLGPLEEYVARWGIEFSIPQKQK